MMRNGELVDPLEHNSKPLQPVSSEEKERFITETKKLSEKLLAFKEEALSGHNLI